jgi:hypothetical protein
MGQVFVSYSRQDSKFVDQLVAALQKSSLSVWIDRSRIQAGESWRGEIVEAIQECDAFLLVLSPQSVNSDNVEKELNLASEYKRRIIPLMYQPAELPGGMRYAISGLQFVDFNKGFNQALDELLSALGARENTASTRRTQSVQRTAAPSPPPPVGLDQILPGTWQIQGAMNTPFAFQIMLEISANGFFQGEGRTMAGMTRLTGQWRTGAQNQLSLQGQTTDGFMVAPYMAMLQFAQVSSHQLVGMDAAGVQVFWQKIG